MTSYEELFRTIADEIEVTDADAFRHRELGEFTLPRDMELTSSRPLLVHLCRTIYLVHHAGDHPSARLFLTGGRTACAVYDLEDYDYTEKLAQSAAGFAQWLPGWVVTGTRADTAVVSQDGLSLVARPEEMSEPAAEIGDEVAIRFPVERRYRVPGWYCVVGESGIPDSSDLVRIYYCLGSPALAPVLLKSVLCELNEHRLTFEVKTVNDPDALVRRDTFVIYLEHEQWLRRREFFTDLWRSHAADLRDDYPRFALRLEKGFSFAHDPDIPGGTMSFGEHRSWLVAEGLLNAFDSGVHSTAGKVAAIAARFRAEGLDIRAPYLNRAQLS